VKTKRHKLAAQNKASSNSISNYLSSKNISEIEKQLSLVAQEATFAHHTHTAVHNNHSFKSKACTTTVVSSLFNDKCTCSQTKYRAIITNVIVPFATK
jgi:predicted nucleic acid-binding protein